LEVTKTKERKLVTVRHSRERIELLAKASTHGAKFCATHGEHLTSDDMFKACEVPVREAEIKLLVQDKEQRLQWQKNEEEAKQVLVFGYKALANYLSPELAKLLAWYQVPANKMGNKHKSFRRWKAILEAEAAGRVAGPFEDDANNVTYQPPVYTKWTPADEAALEESKNREIDIGDTALGRRLDIRKRELSASVRKMTGEERSALRRKLDETDMEQAAADETDIAEAAASEAV